MAKLMMFLIQTLVLTALGVVARSVLPEGLMLSLRGVSYANNSVFFVDEIGVFVGGENNALTCTTQYRPCCFSRSNRHGEWYYPNGTTVPNAATLHNFYRGRTDNGEVYLNHFRNSRSPVGHFWCSLPGIDGSIESIHVTLTARLIFQGLAYPNNSVFTIETIGEYHNGTLRDSESDNNTALMCGTTFRPCCSHEHSYGEWYYPNGTIIYSLSLSRSQSFYSSRGDDGTVHLNHVDSSVTPVGIFRCEIPSNNSEIDVVFAELITAMSATDTISSSTSTTSTESVMISTSLPTTTVTVTMPYLHSGLMLSLRGVSYANNSVFFVDEIGVFVGEENNAFTCTTQYRPCCFSQSNRHGEWYYPNGTTVPNAATLHNFYRGRTDNGEVYLNHFRNSRSPVGHFWCSIPGIDGSIESIHVTLTARLIFQGLAYPNNSVFAIETIGEYYNGTLRDSESDNNTALMCGATFRPCCSHDDSYGEWYYPNGTIIYSLSLSRSQSFYSSRGDDGTVRLNHADSSVTPVGIFRCEIPNKISEIDVIYATLNTADSMETEKTTQMTTMDGSTQAVTTEETTTEETTQAVTTEETTQAVTTEETTQAVTTEEMTQETTTEETTQAVTPEEMTQAVTTEEMTQVVTTEEMTQETTTEETTQAVTTEETTQAVTTEETTQAVTTEETTQAITTEETTTEETTQAVTTEETTQAVTTEETTQAITTEETTTEETTQAVTTEETTQAVTTEETTQETTTEETTQAVTTEEMTQAVTTEETTTEETTQAVTTEEMTQAVTTEETTTEETTQAVTTEETTQAVTTEETTQAVTTEETTQAVTTEETTQAVTTEETTTEETTQAVTTEETTQAVTTEETTQAVTTEETTQAVTTEETTQAITTEETTQAVTTEETTQAMTTEETTQAVTTEETTQAVTTEETTQAVTTEETTQAVTTEETTQAITTEETTQAVTTEETTQAVTTEETTQETTTEETTQTVTTKQTTKEITTDSEEITQAPTMKETMQAVTTKQTMQETTETTQAVTNVEMTQGTLFQLRLTGITNNCEEWVVDDPDIKITQVTSTISAVITAACKCELPELFLTSNIFKCFPGSNDAVSYRAKVLISPIVNASFVLKVMEDWVSQSPSFALSGTIVNVDKTCKVAIASFEACECVCDQESSPEARNDGVVIAAVLAPVLIILIVVIILVLLITVLMVRKHKRGILWISRHGRSSLRQDRGFIPINVQHTSEADSFTLYTNRPMNDYETLPHLNHGSDIQPINSSCGGCDDEECKLKNFKSLDVKDCGDESTF